MIFIPILYYNFLLIGVVKIVIINVESIIEILCIIAFKEGALVMKEPIQVILDYIDENIDEYLTVGNLSEIANYSVPQLFRLFIYEMDITPVKYALRRRLYYAARELVSSDMNIIKIAHSFGFESHDSFCRAFKRVYGVTPSMFRKNAYNLNEFYHNLYCVSGYSAPYSLNKAEKDVIIMSESAKKQEEYESFCKTYGNDVSIVTIPATKLIGVQNPVGGKTWDTFYEVYDKVFRNAKNRKYPYSENATHGIPRPSPDGKMLLYFTGIEVTSLDKIPDGAVGIDFPEQLCAVIGFEGGIDYDTIHYYFEKWTTTQNKYKPDVHKIDPHLPEDFAWKTYAPIWEYYSPNKDCEVYEERIYMPIKENMNY